MIIGWELPALLQNSNVTDIYRVDPDREKPPRLLSKQDPKALGEPRGNWDTMTFGDILVARGDECYLEIPD